MILDETPRIVAIVGSRHWPVPDLVFEYAQALGGLASRVVTGDASGVDRQAASGAESGGIPVTVFRADWSKGKAGGPIRNAQIVAACDWLYAFWDGESRGTLDVMRQLVAAGKPGQVELPPVEEMDLDGDCSCGPFELRLGFDVLCICGHVRVTHDNYDETTGPGAYYCHLDACDCGRFIEAKPGWPQLEIGVPT